MRDDPSAYLPGDRRRSLASSVPIPDRVHGAALFADVSGFTPLTESLALELGPRRGAEELTAHLNQVFHTVIEEINRFGGEVIYFSGDAITCWLDGDDGARATAAAVAVQRAFATVSRIVTPAGHEVVLAIKVAVAVGPARRFVVGDPDVQLIDVLAGRIVDDLAESEQQAEKGDIMLAASAMRAMADRVRIATVRTTSSGEPVGVLDALTVDVAPVTALPEVGLPEALARPWLLPTVWERIQGGHGEFLTELRPACSVFIRFGGIDYDADEAAAGQLDQFIRGVQEALTQYGGNLLGLTIGDKGAYLYCAFGVPNAHEDDAARACRAALEIIELEHSTAARGLQIGITQGRLRAGSYGHERRHTYTCLGDSVNLAARLMSKAPVGQVYVSADIQLAAGPRYVWDPIGDVHVKGKTEPVTVVKLVGLPQDSARRVLRYPLPMVGRDIELAAVQRAREQAVTGTGRIVGISAEAGRGKSRLVAEILRLVSGAGDEVLYGEAESIGRQASYRIWREVLRALFGVDDAEPVERQRERVESRLAAVDPALVRRAPLLGPLLALDIPDNELTRGFDAKLRKESLETLVADVVRARAAAHRGNGAMVVVLEDAQWIDPLSRDLLEATARVTSQLPVLFVVAYRPAAQPGGGLGLEHLPQFEELVLGELGDRAAEVAARAKVRQLFGADVEMAPEVLAVVVDRSAGNPFYLEELIGLLHDQGVDPADPASAMHLDLPDSLHSLVLSRIDTLAEDPRRTLKVASVVGRHFDATLVQRAYPDLGSMTEVDDHLVTGSSADLVTLEQDQSHHWLFRHVVAREVAYESLPFAMRSNLHERIGLELERQDSALAEPDLDLLAHHFSLSADRERTVTYLERAGDAAQSRYANVAAIDYFERLVDLVDAGRQTDLLLRLGRLHELVGSWGKAQETVERALALATAAGDHDAMGWCEVALAEVARKQAHFADAAARLEQASRHFDVVGDTAGVGRVMHVQGTLASQQGLYADARRAYEGSLSIRRRLEDHPAVGALLSNLALVAESEGDYQRARELNEQALAVREGVGDRWAISVSENNLGMIAYLQDDFEGARRRFERSMLLASEVGDRWIVAVGHHNLGNAFRGLMQLDRARGHYERALQDYEDFDDAWSLVQLAEDVIPLVAAEGRAGEAFGLLDSADAVRERLAAPRPPAVAEQLDLVLAPLADQRPVATDHASPNGSSRLGEQVRACLQSPSATR